MSNAALLAASASSTATPFDAVRRRLRLHQAAAGAAKLLAITLGIVLFLALVDHRWELSRSVRGAVVATGACGFLYGLWSLIVAPLRIRLTDLDLAALLDRSGIAAASVASQAQFAADDSPLTRLARERSLQRLDGRRLADRVDPRPLRNRLGVVGGLMLLTMSILALAPRLAGVFADRWLALSDTPWPRDVSIVVPNLVGGELLVPRGEPFPMVAEVTSRRGDDLPLRMRLNADGAPSRRIVFDRLEKTGSDSDIGTLHQTQLPPITERGEILLWAGDGRLGPIPVRPIDRPRVDSLSASGRHPRQAEATTFRIAAGEPMAEYLAESEVAVTVVSNVPATLAVEPSGRVSLDRIDDRTTIVSYRHDEPTTLQLALTGTESKLRSLPSAVTIGLKLDRPPRVSLRHAKVRLRVTPQARIPLTVEASDDAGLASLTLTPSPERFETVEAVDTTESEGAESDSATEADLVDDDGAADGLSLPSPDKMPPRSIAIVEPGQTSRVVSEQELDLSKYAFRAGDLLRVSATAADEAFAGAQTRRSRTVTFRVVKDDELFREILLRLQQVRARLRKATDRAEEMVAEIESGQDDAGVSSGFQSVRREVAAVGKALDASLDEMRYNRLGGEQSWRRIELTITEPLAELIAGRIETQRLTLAGLAKQPPQGERESAGKREESAVRQREIVASLREVLKNMSQWDSFADVFNELDAILSIEKKVNRRTEALKGDDLPSVFDESTIDDAGIFD